MKFSQDPNYNYTTVVRHQGLPIVLASRKEMVQDQELCSVYYRVLATDPLQPEDDKCWSDTRKLVFPDQIRPAGMSLVTVNLKTAEKTADTPFQTVSDGKHVYLFRQSIDHTLYVDRFVLDSAQKILNPNWETRFQRSCKRDLPASRKDTAGAIDMVGEPFLEPTTELTMISDLQEGRFCVLLLPGRLPSEWRWQIFTINSRGEMESFSIRRAEDGLFDVLDLKQTCLKWTDSWTRFQTGPAALLYMQQEEVRDDTGRNQRLKRGARVMLAAPVGASQYALELDGIDDYVWLGNPNSLQIEGDITIEACVRIQATDPDQYLVAHSMTGVYLGIKDGKYQIGYQEQGASFDIPAEDLNAWVHLAGVYDSVQQAWLLYRNGLEVGRFSDSTGAVVVAEDWTIGTGFKGQLNNVRLWNVARSPEQILTSMYQPLCGKEAGLVGYWPIDEGAGDIVRDVVSENHGQIYTGSALDFDGVDDYVALPEMNPDYSNGITIEAWVRYNSFQRFSRIIDFGNGPSQDNIVFNNQAEANNLEFHIYRGARAESIRAIGVLEQDTWMHLAATLDGAGNAALYKNGQRLVTGTVHVPNSLNRAKNYLGRSNWIQDGYFDGSMRDVRVWNLARTREDIQQWMDVALAGDEDGLVCYWPLDEGQGMTVRDKTSQHHSDFHTGHALFFDGMDDYIEVPDNGNLAIDQAITLEAWVKHSGGNGHIVNRGGGWSESGYSLFIYNRNIRIELQRRGEKTIVDNPLPMDEAWHHLAFTWDSGSKVIKTYCDGQLQAKTGQFNGPIGAPSQSLNIGKNAVRGHCYHGWIDEVCIWKVVRSQDEILHGMYVPPKGNEPGLAGYWPINEGAGTEIHDKVSGNHGQLYTGSAKDRPALAFDGVNDYVYMENFEWPMDGPVTMEFWAKVNDADERENSAFTVGARENPDCFQVELSSIGCSLNWDYGDRSGKGRIFIEDYILFQDQWIHVALVSEGKDGQFMGIYLNGELKTSKKESDGPGTLLNGLWIGKGDNFFYKGEMADFRIWNRVRSAEEIRVDMYHRLVGTEPGLVGYWPMDEGSDNVIKDKASGNHGQLFVGSGDNFDSKWGNGPDNPEQKWGAGPDKPEQKWREGPDSPKDKWVVVPTIAIMDFGVSRDGTLALIGDLENRAEVSLGLNGAGQAATLAIPSIDSEKSDMGVIKSDSKGYTVSAGMLNFTRTGDRPFLLEGTDGLIHLYFRGDYGKFLVAQQETLTARAEYIISISGTGAINGGPSLHFIAHRPGSHMNNYEITIANGSAPQKCQVTLQKKDEGIQETWYHVPRNLEQFLTVLNGIATSDENDPLVQAGKLVFYDYQKNVQREGVPDLTMDCNPYHGSALFAIAADNLPDTGEPITIDNIDADASTVQPGLDCAWIPEPKGKALLFDGIDDYVALPPDKLVLAGDLTIEAWINVSRETPDFLRILNYHSEDTRFTLGLSKDEVGENYKVFAGARELALQTDYAPVTFNEWAHLAVVYNATNALKLNGQGYVDCGNDASLGMTEALTVEAWLCPARSDRSQKEVILSRWGRIEAEQSWRLYIDTDGRPGFEIRDDQGTSIVVKTDSKLEKEKFYHLTGVFDATQKKEWAFVLDGNDSVNIKNPASLMIEGAISLEAWVQVQAIDGIRYIIDRSSNNVYLRVSNGQYQFGSKDDCASYPIPPEDLHTWIHLAGVYDSEQKAWLLYRNGIEISRHFDDTGAVNQGDWKIGASFKGQLNHVRIWDRARTRPEILENMDKPASDIKGPVGYWVFDQVDSYSNEVKDLSPNGNKGTRTGGDIKEIDKGSYVQKLFAHQAGKEEKVAVAFDGVNDYVELSEMNPDYTNGFTVEAWVRYDSFKSWSRIIDFGNGSAQDNILFANEGTSKNLALDLYDGAVCFRIKSDNVLESGTWMHLAATVDRTGKAVLYKNGELLVTTTNTITKPPETLIRNKNYLGRSNWTQDGYFDGNMREVRVWNLARSQQQIRDHMYSSLSGIEDGLVGYWPLDDADIQFRSVPDHSDTGNDGILRGGTVVLIDTGEMLSWRWLCKEDAGLVTQYAVQAYHTELALLAGSLLIITPGIKVGDILLLEDEQVRVSTVQQDIMSPYKYVIERGINGTLARNHPRGIKVYHLRAGDSEHINGLMSNDSHVNIGRSASEEDYFQGTIDEVRIWKVDRRAGLVQYYRNNPLPGNVEGLISYWRFEAGSGNVALDAKASNHGRLVHTESDRIAEMWTPSTFNATLVLYINGQKINASDITGLEYGDLQQFSFGAVMLRTVTTQHMAGLMDEVRLWHTVRTREQIRDNMYRSLAGDEDGLTGYWSLDAGTGDTILDRTGNGQDGIILGSQWQDSTAPIGNEGPEVKNVYGGLEKPGFSKQILGPPVVVEYGDLQWDAEGNLFGVMKRCYIFKEAAIQLVTGFKVGDLELNFIGQIQTAPTLIGYIEGAPPVPSENLTVNDPKTDDYVGNCGIQLIEAKETTQVYTASRDTGFDMSVDFKAGVCWATGVYAGLGVSTKVFSSEGKVGIHGYFEHSLGHLSGASVTAGISKTLTKSLILGGGWEEAQDYDQNGEFRYLNPEVGRRYLPNNMGYALVKSATADLFALRLKRTGSLVAYQVLPNPDIPEDWNIIMFPLKPGYVKNGTLDGMVGLISDPTYPGAMNGERGSYFKPLEAYALKEQIEQEAKKIAGYYESFSESAKISTGVEGLPGELGYDWDKGQDKRNMVNTYVWTADGGFYAEEEQFSSIRQESHGSSYHFLGKGGVFADVKLAGWTGFFFEIDALFGGHINTTVSKSQEEKTAFGLHVDVQGEGYLNKWDGDQDKQQGHYLAKPCPGKVDSYRFMTFYLAPKPGNFDKFFTEIVDPEWLNGQGKYLGENSANARALREARSKPNEVWRVMHRVTYVSRIPPELDILPAEAVAGDARRPANVEANMGLIREIERIRRRIPPSPAQNLLMVLGQAVDALLFGAMPGTGQGLIELDEMVPWWFNQPDDVKREIRLDLMTYLKDFYDSDLVPPEIADGITRVTQGVQVLYPFDEGRWQMVHDVANPNNPLNLAIADKTAVRWLPGGLAITGDTIIATPKAATMLIKAARASNEITIEAWIKPAIVTQPDPCGIVSLSGASGRNFMLGQSGTRYLVRLRTTETNDQGSDKELKAGDVAVDTLVHLVYVRTTFGQGRFYVNGVETGHHEVPGNFSNWDKSYRLGLGNEFFESRAWQGEFYLVAIYHRALTPVEIKQNFNAGAGK